MQRGVLCGLFFFQAEDGIRDYKVTGVQTCALPILILCIASTAYDSGITSDTHRSTVCIWSRGVNRPQSRNCGSTNAGRNCTAWNSVRAKALVNRPSAVPNKASSTATSTTAHAGPATLSPSGPIVSADTSTACTSASEPKGSA